MTERQERIKYLCREHRMQSPGRKPTGKNDRADILLEMINDCIKPNDTIIEIGSFKGVATEMFALHCKKLYSIDPYELGDHYKQDGTLETILWAKQHMLNRMKGYGNFEHMQMMSNDAKFYFNDNSIDFIYIDGDHRAESLYNDIRNYFPKIKTNGIIAGHDYYGEMKSVINKSLGEPDKLYGESSWIYYKNKIDFKYIKDLRRDDE